MKYNAAEGDSIFFTSDLHFGHHNIISYCNRPFKDALSMDECLIANWNREVTDSDTVFVLGDFSFSSPGRTLEILGSLRGNKKLILGNHDSSLKTTYYQNAGFSTIEVYLELSIGRDTICLFHYPIDSWNGQRRGWYHLHGHLHSSSPMRGDSSRYDVGVDANNYKPVSWLDIKDSIDAVRTTRQGRQ